MGMEELNYWRWQPEGGNNLESLSVPVLINPQDLRDLMRKPTPDSDFVRALEKARQERDAARAILVEIGVEGETVEDATVDWFYGDHGVWKLPLDEWLRRRREAGQRLAEVEAEDPRFKKGLKKLTENLDGQIERRERAEAQLAACAVAATDLNKAEELTPDDYGWSASFEAVLKLHRKYEQLGAQIHRLVEQPVLVDQAQHQQCEPQPPAPIRTPRILHEIHLERARQVDKKGYSVEQDMRFEWNELARGAAAYCLAQAARNYKGTPRSHVHLTLGEDESGKTRVTVRIPMDVLAHELWPFDVDDTFKPHSHRRNLIKAAAMIVAELEAIDRREAALQETQAEIDELKKED